MSLFVHCYPPAKGGVEYLAQKNKTILDHFFLTHVLTGPGLTLDSYKSFDRFYHQPQKNIHRLPLYIARQKIFNKLLGKIINRFPYFSPFYFGPHLDYNPMALSIIKNSKYLLAMGLPTKSVCDATYFSKKYALPLIFFPCYHDVNYYNHCPYFQSATDQANSVIFLTKFEKKAFIKNYSVDTKKTRIITFCPYSQSEIGIQHSRLSRIIKTKQKLLLQKNIIIGYLGQITRRKNLSLFKSYLDCYHSYWSTQGFNLSISLSGARSNTSSDVEQSLGEYIKNNIIQINYDFPETQKKSILGNLTLFLNPSSEESLGIVNFESIFSGIPVILPKNAAFSEFLTGCRFDTLFEDIHGLHQIIHRLITNPDLYRQSVLDQYNILSKINMDAYSSQLLSLF